MDDFSHTFIQQVNSPVSPVPEPPTPVVIPPTVCSPNELSMQTDDGVGTQLNVISSEDKEEYESVNPSKKKKIILELNSSSEDEVDFQSKNVNPNKLASENTQEPQDGVDYIMQLISKSESSKEAKGKKIIEKRGRTTKRLE